MKAATTPNPALEKLRQAKTTGEARSIASNAMMALASGEISTAEANAVSKELASMSRRLQASARKE